MKMLIPRNNHWHGLTSTTDLFDAFFTEFGQMPDLTSGFSPACDIEETEDHFLLSMDLPGVNESDITIEQTGDRLVITGERHQNLETKEGFGLRFERSYGKFQRSFFLPNGVSQEQVQAHFENGVLSVAIPKPEVIRKKNIPIQSGKNSIFSRLLSSSKSKTEEKAS